MVDKICETLVKKMKEESPEMSEEQAEIILYGIQLIIGEIPKIFFMFITGFILGVGWQSIFAFFIMLPYRYASGGFHLKTHVGCIICTNVYYCGNAYISTLFVLPSIYKYIMASVLLVVGILFVSKYAPADTENLPILRKKERKMKKILSYIFLIINIILIVSIPNSTISNILMIGTILQTISITKLAYKITKNEYGYEQCLKQQEKMTIG